MALSAKDIQAIREAFAPEVNGINNQFKELEERLTHKFDAKIDSLKVELSRKIKTEVNVLRKEMRKGFRRFAELIYDDIKPEIEVLKEEVREIKECH